MNTPHLLLATDLMEGSHSLGLKAIKIAKQLSATLSIIHVIEIPTSAHYAQALGFADILAPSVKSAQAVLATLSDELGIPIERQYVKDGCTVRLIIQLADTLNVDAIIIGSHSQNAFHTLLGSTASTILHKAKCDVLTLKTNV